MDFIDIHKIKQGDEGAFKTFFEYFYPKMMALACRFVDEQTAKDLVHDTFTTYWKQKQTVEITNLASFLYKCLQNHCLNHLKHRAVVKGYEAEIRIAEARIDFLRDKTDHDDVLEQIYNRNLHEIIDSSVRKLPPRTAEAFRLYFYRELSQKEIAGLMNISLRTVETHIRQALLFLRKDLKGLSFLLTAYLLFQ